MSTQRGRLTYIRDAILFVVGVALILKQAGIGFPPPEGGVELELLFIGALFCNGPLFLSYLGARRGSPGLPPVSEPPPPSEPSSVPSSGGE